jgi:hydroxyethylthiazole kinase-like uncharacterized protein yjeF
MMENARNALAKQLLLGLHGNIRGKKVAIVCDLSNNGGVGFSSARHLSYYGANVSVILLGRPAHIRIKDSKLQWTTIEKTNVISITIDGKNDLLRMRMTIADSDGIIDAILGTGYSDGKIREPASGVIDSINNSVAYIVSNDVSSRVDADTVIIQEKAVAPDYTIILHIMKLGLQNKKIVTGSTGIVSIGIP